jgi:3,4-dihydroxy 2-butanone 4-phosphate synthase/GTP cyclohydrolase II
MVERQPHVELRELGVGKMKLLANPRKMPSMTGFDLEVTGYLPKP